MAGLDSLWSRFTLDEDEEHGVEAPQPVVESVHRLAGRFFTKRTLNVDSIACTFKPLWKSVGELKIRDIGDNILLFEFEDNLDLERVLEYEPWTFDKHIVIFERVSTVEEIPSLEFLRAIFWVQFHNIPKKSLNPVISEVVGNSIGKVIEVADPEDDGNRGEFLRVRISIDISKPLPRCRKLWYEGKQIGWVGLKYERLPNFCYWCGRLSHVERDCELWIRGKENLKKENQQFREWMRADMIRPKRKTVTVIQGSARNQAPWWRKTGSKGASASAQAPGTNPPTRKHTSVAVNVREFMREVVMEETQAINNQHVESSGVNEEFNNCNVVDMGGTDGLTKSIQGLRMDKCMGKGAEVNIGLKVKEVVDLTKSHAQSMLTRPSLRECTNVVGTQPTPNSLKSFKRLAREVNTKQQAIPPEGSTDRRMGLELEDDQGSKKKLRTGCEWFEQENFQVETGV